MLDPARARAEADAAERRGAGTLWGAEPVEWDAVSLGAVAQPEVVPVVDDGAEPARSRPRVASVPRREPATGAQEVPTALLAAILARLEMVPPAADGVPAWLADSERS